MRKSLIAGYGHSPQFFQHCVDLSVSQERVRKGVDRLRKHCGLLSLTVRRPPLLPAQHCSSAQHLRLAAITCLWKWPSPCSLPYSSLSAETLFLFIPTTLLKVTASALVSCSLLKHQLGFFLPALDHQQQQDHWHQHRQIQWSLLAPLLAFFRHHGHFSKFSITSPITMEGCLVCLFFPAPNPGHRAQGPRLLCTSLSPPSWSHLTATSQALGASPVPSLLKLLPYLDTQMLDNPFHIWWAKQSLHIRATSPHLGSKSAILTLKHTISQLMREGRNSLSLAQVHSIIHPHSTTDNTYSFPTVPSHHHFCYLSILKPAVGLLAGLIMGTVTSFQASLSRVAGVHLMTNNCHHAISKGCPLYSLNLTIVVPTLVRS